MGGERLGEGMGLCWFCFFWLILLLLIVSRRWQASIQQDFGRDAVVRGAADQQHAVDDLVGAPVACCGRPFAAVRDVIGRCGGATGRRHGDLLVLLPISHLAVLFLVPAVLVLFVFLLAALFFGVDVTTFLLFVCNNQIVYVRPMGEALRTNITLTTLS